VAHNLGFNNGQQMASARVTICSPFSNDRRQRLVINANQFRNARSYAKSAPPRFHKVGDVDGRRLRFCGRFAEGYSGAPSSPLRRKKGSILYVSNYFLAAFRCSGNPIAAIAMALMTAPIEAAFPPPPRRLIATVLLQHRSDLDPT
jgi:hypothetical protein